MKDFQAHIEWAKRNNSDLTIRKATESDGNSFVSLYNQYYKNRKTSIDYFKWQFLDSPFDSQLFLVLKNDELIAYCGLKIYLLSNNLSTGFVIDFLIDEAYRKRGIAFLLEDAIASYCKERGVLLLSALPNPFGNAALKAMGWTTVAKVDSMVLDLKENHSITKIEAKPQEVIEELVKFYKDETYRSWRFDQSPVYCYENVSKGNKAVAVTKLFFDSVNGIIYGDIVDIVVSEHEELAEPLIDEVIKYMNAKQVKTLTCWAFPHTKLYAVLINKGFKSMPQNRFFCVKPLSSENEYLVSLNKWDIVEADSEVY
jgi:GNAT superfamily N-acetyltransferase